MLISPSFRHEIILTEISFRHPAKTSEALCGKSVQTNARDCIVVDVVVCLSILSSVCFFVLS